MAYATNTVVVATTEIVAQRSVPAVKLSAATIPVYHGEKLEKFNGLNFKRWQRKMLFFPTTLNFARFLIEEPPKLSEGETNMQVVNVVDA